MSKQGNKSKKKQISIEAMLYGLAQTSTSVNIVVLTQISIVVLTCCRIVVLKCGNIYLSKQKRKSAVQ
ncbi:hypothetical protein [Viscerimonas tarda]|nr:hypothetical protein FACS189426_14010 [Bacteroidia bacterium]GHV71342.1 hypothetical protein FACS189420_6110 [Bacteroidia bacterium]